MYKATVASLAFVFASGSPAMAETVRIDFSGSLTNISGTASNAFSLNQVVSGYFTYESDLTGSDVNSTVRLYDSPLTIGNLFIGDYNIAFSSGSRVFVTNDEVSNVGQKGIIDRFIFENLSPIGANIFSLSPTFLALNWQDNSATAFDDTKLITTAAGFARFYPPPLIIDFNGSTDGSNRIQASLVSFSVNGVAAGVPEPATWAMMIVGFGFVGAALRRRRNNNARTLIPTG